MCNHAGIKPTVGNASLDRVKYVIDECKNAKIAAKDIVVLRLKENIQHLSDKKAELEKAMKNGLLSETNRKKIEAKISAVEERQREKIIKIIYYLQKSQLHLKQW